MAAGGGKKKKGFLQSCLTNTVVVVIIIYLLVLGGSALVTTFLNNGGKLPFLQVTSAAPANQPATTTASSSNAQPYSVSGGVSVPATQGSGAVGGSVGGQASLPQGPRQISVAYSARYIVEQADVVQNGRRLTFDESLQFIAGKLLASQQDLKAVNPNTLGKGIIYPGMVIIVPNNVVVPNPTPNPLPNTGRYADPAISDNSDNTDPNQ